VLDVVHDADPGAETRDHEEQLHEEQLKIYPRTCHRLAPVVAYGQPTSPSAGMHYELKEGEQIERAKSGLACERDVSCV
jgi:hypothetical protein